MTIATRLKDVGWNVLGLAVIAGMIAIGIGLLTGAAAFSVWVLQWTFPAFLITLLVSLFLLAPLSLIPPARRISAAGFMIASFAFGSILWVWGMAYTYLYWGILGVIVGLVLLGIGVVPIAMFAALLHGDWGNLGAFVLAAMLTFGLRGLAGWLDEKAKERGAYLGRADVTVRATHIHE